MNTVKFEIGQKVAVKPSAQIDVCGIAWPYLERKIGTIKQVHVAPTESHGNSISCAVEFDELFTGGWDCFGDCMAARGQLISQQHLEIV